MCLKACFFFLCCGRFVHDTRDHSVKVRCGGSNSGISGISGAEGGGGGAEKNQMTKSFRQIYALNRIKNLSISNKINGTVFLLPLLLLLMPVLPAQRSTAQSRLHHWARERYFLRFPLSALSRSLLESIICLALLLPHWP